MSNVLTCCLDQPGIDKVWSFVRIILSKRARLYKQRINGNGGKLEWLLWVFSIKLSIYNRTVLYHICGYLQWRHNESDDVPNLRRLYFLLNRLFRCRSKSLSKLCVTGVCVGNPPVSCGFSSQRATNAENIPLGHVIMYYVWHTCLWFGTVPLLYDLFMYRTPLTNMVWP